MHEFSLAVNIVEIAEDNAQKSNAKKVNSIEIEVGEVSGVIIDALEFAMESAIKGTILEKSDIIITNVPAMAKCMNCSHEFSVKDMFSPCPKCSDMSQEIISGKDMQVKSMNIE